MDIIDDLYSAVQQGICSSNVVFNLTLFGNWLFSCPCVSINAWHMHPLPIAFSLFAVNKMVGFCLCMNGREGEWWKGRADSDAVLNTDERKASWILIRLPSSLSSALPQLPSLSKNTSQKCAFLNQGEVIRSAFQRQGPALLLTGASITVFVNVELTSSWILMMADRGVFQRESESPALCLTAPEAELAELAHLPVLVNFSNAQQCFRPCNNQEVWLRKWHISHLGDRGEAAWAESVQSGCDDTFKLNYLKKTFSPLLWIQIHFVTSHQVHLSGSLKVSKERKN